MPTINKLRQLNNKLNIPVLGLGVYKIDNRSAESVVFEALKIGYRHFDSAQSYLNEEGVAKGIQKWLNETPGANRANVFFTTKIGDSNHGYEKTKEALEGSLKKVANLSYIDLVLVHSPQSNREKRLGTWRALQEYVEAGKVKSIGISNYGIRHLQELLEWDGLKIKPVINQLEINPWLTRKELVDFCHKEQIEVEAYSPLTRGKRLNDPDLIKLAKKYEKEPGQILIRWSLQSGFIVIPKTTHKERLIGNLDVLNFNISDEDIKLLTHPDDYYVTTWDPVKYEG